MNETPKLTSPVQEALQALQQKVVSLLEKHQKLKEELHAANEKLHAVEKENGQLKQQIQQKDEMVQTLKHQVKMNKIAHVATNKKDQSTIEARKTLTKYINEIDKCISQLME